jgi:hypothetical protein
MLVETQLEAMEKVAQRRPGDVFGGKGLMGEVRGGKGNPSDRRPRTSTRRELSPLPPSSAVPSVWARCGRHKVARVVPGRRRHQEVRYLNLGRWWLPRNTGAFRVPPHSRLTTRGRKATVCITSAPKPLSTSHRPGSSLPVHARASDIQRLHYGILVLGVARARGPCSGAHSPNSTETRPGGRMALAGLFRPVKGP